jgi:hypothetical protein
MTLLGAVGQWLIVFVFAASAVGKAVAFGRFRDGIPALWPVPRRSLTPLAGLVVAGELAVVVLAAVPATRAVGLILAAALLLAFSVVIVRTLRAASGAACNCFGGAIVPLAPRHLLRNGFLLASVVAGLRWGGATALGGPHLAWALALAFIAVIPVALLDEFSYALGTAE